ncbi:putative ATP12, ATP synthase F1-assembly protein [Helianthus annuus]|nr:putative ATP12, ATP synthase F1-assembly protein [Helianthus annuus]
MFMLFVTRLIVGKRFYKQVTIRLADGRIGTFVMLDYRAHKTPSKRPLKCPTISLAKAIASDWEYQVDFDFSLKLITELFIPCLLNDHNCD